VVGPPEWTLVSPSLLLRVGKSTYLIVPRATTSAVYYTKVFKCVMTSAGRKPA
jgi:hypothetical protein